CDSVANLNLTVNPGGGTCTISISGTVWDDYDNSAGGTFNIVTTGKVGTSGGGLFAILLDNNGNVLQSVSVSTDGTYSFAGVSVNTSVTIQLSITAGIIGNPPPPPK